ncbi:MAG: Ig-like domain-containing protein, partial [Candidatus Bipolaricaulaceae bacterium]
DSCGATTEVPVTIRIRVVDKVPPSIVYPARDETVECDGQGNLAELGAWLASHGGAWATDNCCDVLWTNDYRPEKFVRTCGNAGYVTVTFTATDCAGNASSTTATFRVVDTTPPEFLSIPGDVDLGCNPQDTGPDVTGWPAAHDNCDPNPMLSYSDRVSQVGCGVTIERTWRVTDACGHTVQAPRVQRITYTMDTEPPVLNVPPDVTVECHQVPPVGVATAWDNCDPAPAVEYLGEERVDGPCPHTYTLIRTWRATDRCGNTGTKSQRITVRDTTAPVLTVPSDVDLGCNPPDTGPNVTGWATAQDNCDPSPQVSYTDNVFQVGCRMTIQRTWMAQDACGNTSQAVQRITYIQDTTPPTINCPSGVTAYIYGCRGPSEVWVSFPRSATDNCDPQPQVWCTPSGGWFSEGTTWVTVEYGARDACGNETLRTCTFPVTVVRINNRPVARPDSVYCDGFCSIPVLANDYDPDGDPITLLDAYAQCGTAWVSGSTVYYTTAGWSCAQPPGPGMTDTIIYVITDGCLTATGTVTVHITCQICPLALPPGGGP